MDLVPATFAGLAILLVFTAGVWAVSLQREDVSTVDRVWGLLFVVLAVFHAVVGDGPLDRRVLLAVLTTIWGIRLSAFITWRNWGKGEDPRYAAMRRKNPEGFPRKSLVTVFWLQAVLAWIIAAPLLYPAHLEGGRPLGWLDAAGVLVWAIGLTFEAGGDFQLSRFLADPANKGKVMDQGLWRYTRHPNYFGDVTVWIGYAIIATAGGAWWGWYGTVLMAVFIIRVSGVSLTDKVMGTGSKREGYDEYVRRTNTFIPGPPKD